MKNRPQVYINVLFALVLIAALLIGARFYNLRIQAVRTQCAGYGDLGNLAAANLPVAQGKPGPSRFVISFIGHERTAFYGLGCPGHLKHPTSQFARWAHTYHVRYR
jgi:hypothetical protein